MSQHHSRAVMLLSLSNVNEQQSRDMLGLGTAAEARRMAHALCFQLIACLACRTAYKWSC
jgi:hypothetical protein